MVLLSSKGGESLSVQEIIKRRRLELDLTLKDVAKALGVAEGTVSRYESGDIQNMGIDKIEALAHILRCSPGYLMGWQESTPTTAKDEAVLISTYNKLNKEGKQKLLERATELVELGYIEKGEETKMA